MAKSDTKYTDISELVTLELVQGQSDKGKWTAIRYAFDYDGEEFSEMVFLDKARSILLSSLLKEEPKS